MTDPLAGKRIRVDNFASRLDDLDETTETHTNQIADLTIRVLTDANVGYREHTAGDSDQLIATNSGLFQSIGATFQTVAGRVIKTTFNGRATSPTAGDVITFILAEDVSGTPVPFAAGDVTIPFNDALCSITVVGITAPDAGFHTYRLFISMTNGVGPGGYIGSGPAPATFLIEDIGEQA